MRCFVENSGIDSIEARHDALTYVLNDAPIVRHSVTYSMTLHDTLNDTQ